MNPKDPGERALTPEEMITVGAEMMDELNADQPHRLLFERGSPGRVGIRLPELTVEEATLPPSDLLRDNQLDLPNLSEFDVMTYIADIEKRVYGVEDGPYPLGSCSMLYNPAVNELIAGIFANIHPDQPTEQVQGVLEVMASLQDNLMALTGMDAVSLTPMAGAQAELAGILMFRKYHEERGELEQRTRILVPDSAHGTNPATASMVGFEVTEVKSDADGNVDLADLALKLGDGSDVAGMMLTLPSTLGLYDSNVKVIAEMLHERGALLYGDGANSIALAGRVKPGDLGFDAWHINTHKTLSTPHGGGGPGAGPILVDERLTQYLPGPIVAFDEGRGIFDFVMPERSIGRLGGAFGNVGVKVRAEAYLSALGIEGVRAQADNSVRNANYLLKLVLAEGYEVPYSHRPMHMHEFVISMQGLKKLNGIGATDISKALIERSHPPTNHFPLTVQEALMVEPTSTQTKEGLDRYAQLLGAVLRIARVAPEYLRQAPYSTPVRRVDEAKAGRDLILNWRELQTAERAADTATN